MEGEQPELDAERYEEARGDEDRRVGVDGGHPLGHVVHRERAGDAVGARDREQEDERPQQVHRGEHQRRPQLAPPAPVRGQRVRGRHGELEEDVEVEDVAGEEQPGQPPGEQEHEPGERPYPDPGQHLVGGRRQQDEHRQHREDDTEHVGVQHDPHPGGPATGDDLLAAVAQHLRGEHGQQRERGGEHGHREPADVAAAPVQRHEHDTGHPGQQQRHREDHDGLLPIGLPLRLECRLVLRLACGELVDLGSAEDDDDAMHQREQQRHRGQADDQRRECQRLRQGVADHVARLNADGCPATAQAGPDDRHHG